MPGKKRPKFKTGDAIRNEWGWRGIILSSEEAQQEALQTETLLWEAISQEITYSVEWFEGQKQSPVVESRLTLCEGVNRRVLCYGCRYRSRCLRLTIIHQGENRNESEEGTRDAK